MKTTIAILGTGRMGTALATAFLSQQHPTHVFNRTRARSEPLRERGATIATSVAEAVAAAQAVFVCVSDYTSASRLLQDPDVVPLLRNKLLVQLGSGSPREAREAASWASSHDVRYLDGAIMATPNFIGEAHCTILYAGEPALYTRHEQLLRVLGGNPQYVSKDPGHASALDSALLAFMWGELFGILQGIVVSEAEGLSLEVYAQNLEAIKPVLASAVSDMTARAKRRHYAADETTLASLEAHHGAFQHLREICASHRLNDALPAAFGKLFEAAMARGHGGDDFTVLHSFMGAVPRPI